VIVAAEKMGTETTTCARNISTKYYTAYGLALEPQSQVDATRK